jgi:alkanesulfonate monooxygenase
MAGVGRALSGVGNAIVGDPDRAAGMIRKLAEVEVSSFTLSGYSCLEECDLFAKYVMPQLMSLR